MRKTATERQEGRALWEWASLHPICRDYLFHIPNGGSRNKIEAHNLKLEGVRAGVSDYFLAYPKEIYMDGIFRTRSSGLWIELKTTKGKPTKLQKEWLERMSRAGYCGYVAYGWEDAKQCIQEYLQGYFHIDSTARNYHAIQATKDDFRNREVSF